MSRLFLLFLSILSVSCALRIMTFNINKNGSQVTEGLRKVANHISNYNPDIVSLQETKPDTVPILLKYLGSGWSGVQHCKGHISALTKHTILGLYEHVTRGFNVRIYLNSSGQEISFWAYDSTVAPNYAPLNANDKDATVDKLLGREKERVKHVAELIKHPEFARQVKNSHSVPVIVAGCLETPSHLDWTEATKFDHGRKGFVINWPVTRLLTNAAGLTDSFREVHPDPKNNSGNTWHSTRYSSDRIDYIFYRGSLKPTNSWSVNGTASSSVNEWPSDHYAVITDFVDTWPKQENAPTFFVGSEYPNGPFKAIEKCPLKIHL